MGHRWKKGDVAMVVEKWWHTPYKDQLVLVTYIAEFCPNEYKIKCQPYENWESSIGYTPEELVFIGRL